MKKKHNKKNFKTDSTSNKAETVSIHQPIKEIMIDSIPVLEYLEIVQKEYEFERNKKESLENRVGIILTLIGAILVFVLGEMPLNDIFKMGNKYITNLEYVQTFLKSLLVMGIYISFIYTIIKLYKVIKVDKHDTFPVHEINASRLLEGDRIKETSKIVLTYVEIIKSHRILNNSRAESFEKGLRGLLVSLILVGIYINFS